MSIHSKTHISFYCKVTVPLRSIVGIQDKILWELQLHCCQQMTLFFCCRRPIQNILSLATSVTRPHNNSSCYSCCHDARYWSVFIVALLSFLHTDGIFGRSPYSIYSFVYWEKTTDVTFYECLSTVHKRRNETHSSKLSFTYLIAGFRFVHCNIASKIMLLKSKNPYTFDYFEKT